MAGLPPVVKIVAFSCTHCPVQDKQAIKWLCSQIADFKPDVLVHLGDWMEADAASRWPSEETYSLEEEIAEADRVAVEIHDAAPEAERVWLLGNHDKNILDKGRIDGKVRSMCDFRRPQFDDSGEQINKNLLGWKIVADYHYCRTRGVVRFGQVTLAHGYEAGTKADENHSVLLGCPMGLYVGGHTHRPTHVTQAIKSAGVPLPYWYANAGCLRDLSPHYMRRQRGFQWGHGCVLIEADTRVGPHKSLRMSRRWTAETKIRGMFSDWEAR